MPTCSLPNCSRPAKDEQLRWKKSTDARQRSALLADFKDGYHLCSDHRCGMAENDKSTCTDVVVKDGKCQYHYDRAVKQQQQPRGSRRSSSVAGPSVPASSTSSDRIGPHGPVAPLPQASTSESHNAINPRSPLHPPPRPPTSIDPNTIIPRSVVGPLPQPSSSTISNLDNINNPPLRSATYPGSLIPPVVPTAVMPPPPAVTPLPQPSLYWLETVPSNPIIKGNIIPISSSYLLMPDSAPMSPEGLDTLNKNVQRLKRLIQVCHGRTIEQATAGWAWCMSRLVDESPCLALHQESPIDVVPADRAPNPALTSSFLHCWQRYCKTWGLRLLVQCTSTRRQEEVMWERRQVVHEDEVVFHNHKAMLHPPALRSVDDPSDELADMEGYRYVSTPGALWDMPVDMPRLLQLTSGRLACFVSDDTVTSLAILSSGHSLILRPGVKLTVYSIEPSIMQFRGFLDYRSIRLVNSSSPRIIQVVTCYMGMALEEGTWDPTDIEKVLAGFKHTEAEDELLSSLRQMAKFALDEKVLARPARG